MLHPSRLFSLILICFLVYSGLKSLSQDSFIVEGSLKDSLTIVGEPLNNKGRQKFIAADSKGARFEITTNQFPIYEVGEIINVVGNSSLDNPTNYHKANNINGILRYPKIQKIDRSTSGYLILKARLIRTKKILAERVNILFSEPQAGLINGILLGDRSGFSDKNLAMFSRTGVSHIVALSGFNITIIVMFLLFVTSFFPRNLSFLFCFAGIILFVLATGLSPSIIRAGLMGMLVLVSKLIGRKSDPLVSLLLTASLMVAENPNILLYDIGFELSFVATVGLFYLSPILVGFLQPLGRILSENLAINLSAILLTWPLISFYFGTFSNIAVIANLLIVPFIGWLMLVGFSAAVLSFFLPILAEICSYIGWVLASYMLKVVEICSSLSLASVTFRVESPWFLFGYYLFIILIIYILKKEFYWKQKNLKH